MPDSASKVTSETIEALLGRQSIRKYSDRPVTDAELRAILDAAVRAPTSSNFQAYSIVVVRDQALKEQISVPAGNQKHIITCPVFLAFCADISRIETALKRNGKDLEDNNLEVGLVSSVDAALVGMAAYIAAESLGIQGVMIGAVRNDPEKGRLTARTAEACLSGVRDVSRLAGRGPEAETPHGTFGHRPLRTLRRGCGAGGHRFLRCGTQAALRCDRQADDRRFLDP
jgi:hypothetical protein